MSLVKLLSFFQGYRTKIAAVVIALLALNSVWEVIPASALQPILLAAGGAGLYFLRDAIAQLEKQLGIPATPTEPTS